MKGNKLYTKSSKDVEKSTFSRKTAAAEILTNLESEKTYLIVSIIALLVIVIFAKLSFIFSVISGISGAVILGMRLRNIKGTIEYLRKKYKIK